MITRLVKMEFAKGKDITFKAVFKSAKHKIRGRKGCTHLELLQDANEPTTFFTYSKWESEDDLNAYRHSELFKETWAKTKAMFADKAKAWSVNQIEQLP